MYISAKPSKSCSDSTRLHVGPREFRFEPKNSIAANCLFFAQRLRGSSQARVRCRMGSALSRSSPSHRAPSPYPSFDNDTMLVQVMSVVDNVTSTVPLPVMLLTNAIRALSLIHI